MSNLASFLERLLTHGEIVYGPRPQNPAGDRAGCVRLLESAYENARLEIAGVLIPFDAETALAAGWFVALAGWYLVCDEEPTEKLEANLVLPTRERTGTAHLSADLTLQFAGTIHRRARSRAADDPLTRLLERELRRWPLSGVLADLSAEPVGDLSFGGHPGLQLLYAERWAKYPKPHWLPKDPRTRNVVEWVTDGTQQ